MFAPQASCAVLRSLSASQPGANWKPWPVRTHCYCQPLSMSRGVVAGGGVEFEQHPCTDQVETSLECQEPV